MTAASDLDILMPEREITIGGETITVNEINFGQTMQLSGSIKPLIAELQHLFVSNAEMVSLDQVMGAFWKHNDLLVTMLNMSTGLPEEKIKALPASEGYQLSTTFCAVNMGFLGLWLQMLNEPVATSPLVGAGSLPI